MGSKMSENKTGEQTGQKNVNFGYSDCIKIGVDKIIPILYKH